MRRHTGDPSKGFVLARERKKPGESETCRLRRGERYEGGFDDMKLPYLTAATAKAKQQIIAFGGVNYSLGAKDGELLESLGLSSSRFPCLSQREGRKTAGTYTAPTGLYARGKLCVVDGTDFLYDGKAVGQVTAGEKQFATINTKIVIFPDKVYYDTKEEKFGNLGATYSGYAGDVTFTANTLRVPEKSYIDESAESAETLTGIGAEQSITVYTGAVINKADGALALTGGEAKTPDALKDGDIIQYECDSAKEYQIVQSSAKQSDGTYQITYTLHKAKLHEYADFEELFKAGDAIEISGCTSCKANNGSHIIRSISGRQLTFSKDIFQNAGTEAGTVLLERKVPELTCVCECDNRIWGAEGTTIYASALGDPSNFFVYDGLSTDSYAVAVGTDGEFTGCIAYSSTVLFWKENCVHKVLGDYPAQYQIYTYTVPGIQKGSEKSLSIINETLFYKGRSGVYAYSGGTPELISENFGTRRFYGAVAGNDGQKYYISMKDETGNWHLYVFDTLQGIWLREDGTHALDFAYLDGVLYYLDGTNGKLVMTGQDHAEEGAVRWSATLCQMDETTHGRKGYSRLYLRADMETGAWMKVEISADGGPFRQVFSTHNERAKTVQIPILTVRCDNFRIRLSGKGTCVIKSIIREFSVGSEY